MDGLITGENDERVGLSVIDNDDVEHVIEMEFDGEIKYHQQDGYPDDPANRTDEEDEHVAQSRRYAKWYVYQNTEYDTVPPYRNPDRIAGTLVTIRAMDDEQFREQFGTLFQQFRSYEDDSVERPFELEDAAPAPELVFHLQELSLDAEIDDLRDLHREYVTELAEFVVSTIGDMIDEGVFSSLASDIDALMDRTQTQLDQHEDDLPQFEFDRVSDPSYLYTRGRDRSDRIVGGERPPSEETDTLLTLLPGGSSSLELFRLVIMHHLLCQIRDRYIGMGIEPPAAYRTLGHGMQKYSIRYKTYDMYPEYFDPNADIDGYGFV